MQDVAGRLDGVIGALARYETQGCVIEPPAMTVLLGALRHCAEDAAALQRALAAEGAGVVALPVLGAVC